MSMMKILDIYCELTHRPPLPIVNDAIYIPNDNYILPFIHKLSFYGISVNMYKRDDIIEVRLAPVQFYHDGDYLFKEENGTIECVGMKKKFGLF